MNKKERAPTVEEIIDYQLKNGGYITDDERKFIDDMRHYAARGVGYGWMRQVIQWEWNRKLSEEAK